MNNLLESREWTVGTRFNIPITVDCPIEDTVLDTLVSLDVEDDEQSNFVGLGIYCPIQNRCYYWADFNVVKHLNIPKFIAHNGKTDLTKLKKWGFNVDESYLVDDTIIASYVRDATAKSHGLKSWAEVLAIPYPRYEDIVGKGRNKQTLDKQDVQLVAEYNACDTVTTWKLWQHLQKIMTPAEMKYYKELEMSIERLTWKMQQQGVKVDIQQLKEFQKRLQFESDALYSKLQYTYGDDFNPRSTKQVKESLGILNARADTLRKATSPVSKDLLRYKKIQKLLSTYIKPYLESNGELYPEFNQVSYSKESKTDEGIRTGRLSSRNPNFQNLPSHTQEGLGIRNSVIPRKGNIFCLADYSQIELRVLAHFCDDKRMTQAFKDGRDIHEETATAIGCTRDIAKTINFALVYGSGAYNLSDKTGITVPKAQMFLNEFDKQFPMVHGWKKAILYSAHIKGYITTLLGRQINWKLEPNCKKHSRKADNQGKPCNSNCAKRIEGEADRRAISAIIQGSAAEIIKLAMLKLDKSGFIFPVQEHDALLFEIPVVWSDYPECIPEIRKIMESIVQLSVPLKVDIKTGNSWRQCKA